ncbi:MAG TPA: hypothetical protein VIO60_10400 [Rectinemataceae bacterium]
MLRGSRKKRRSGLGLAAFTAALAYLFLAHRPLGGNSPLELVATLTLPESRVSLAEAPARKESDISFSSTAGFGFLDLESRELKYYARPEGAAEEGSRLIVPNTQNGSLELWDRSLGSKRSLSGGGLPYLQSGRLFAIRMDQSGASEYDSEGKLLWSWEFGSFLTSSSIGERASAWGCMDGTILIQREGHSGLELLRPSAFGSPPARDCVYGVAISPEGKRLAVLYGQEPQNALFFEERGSGWGLAHSVRLPRTSFRAQEALFSQDGTWAVMQTASGLLVYDAASRTSSLQLSGTIGEDDSLRFVRLGDTAIAFLAASKAERRFGLMRGSALEAWIRVEDGASGIVADERGYVSIAGETSLRVYAERKEVGR